MIGLPDPVWPILLHQRSPDLGFFGVVSSFGKPLIYNNDNIKTESVTFLMAHQRERLTLMRN